jgi:long-chain acyl-CoA synthetase
MASFQAKHLDVRLDGVAFGTVNLAARERSKRGWPVALVEDDSIRPRIAPVYSDDARLAALIGPGGPFEVEQVVVDGVLLRSFLRAPRTIVDVFRMSRNHEDRVYLVFEGERLTFRDVRRQVLSLARALRDRFDVAQGDRVALAMRNFPEFIVGFWAAALLGAVVVPLNAWWTRSELIYAVDDAAARVVIADEERLERLARLEGGRPGGAQLIAVRTAVPEGYESVPMDVLIDGEALEDDDFAALGPDDPVTILYTSGTTGRPKGALGTNRGTIANLMNMAFAGAREAVLSERAVPAPQQGATIAAQPLFHIGGIASIVGGAMSGSKMVLMRRWSLDEVLARAKAEHVTTLGGVPTLLRQILERAGVGDLGLDVRSVPMGGASVPPDLPRKALEVFGDSIQILNGYGLTETTSAVVTNVGAEYAEHPGSVGRPNLTADIRVESADGRVVGIGVVGELCVRSPQVVKGYWNLPDDTEASFVNGWFHTGDLGYVDEEGFVYVVDRLKDVVIRGGENVYCAEVEAVLIEHPLVAEVAVVGLREEVMGERVCAVIVSRQGSVVELDDLRDFAARRLATFKCPEALFPVDELPLTPTGKTAKIELRERLSEVGAVIQRSW